MTSMASRSNGDTRLTIDQLAQRTGMTVRNIRAHQSRGLLPPPVVEARTGYYDEEHLARIKLIQEMQAEGFNLKAIERLIEGASGGVEEALGFKRAALTPLGDDRFEVPSPTLLGAGEELVKQGVPIEHVLAVADRVIRHSGAVADAFVRVFVDDILWP